jgi:hypothetical protein
MSVDTYLMNKLVEVLVAIGTKQKLDERGIVYVDQVVTVARRIADSKSEFEVPTGLTAFTHDGLGALHHQESTGLVFDRDLVCVGSVVGSVLGNVRTLGMCDILLCAENRYRFSKIRVSTKNSLFEANTFAR